jgi:hypothetical protein
MLNAELDTETGTQNPVQQEWVLIQLERPPVGKPLLLPEFRTQHSEFSIGQAPYLAGSRFGS